MKPYQQLKQQLTGIANVKLIEYFNDQYAGVLHTSPVLFIEFPQPLEFETRSKDEQQAAFTVRVHTVTKVMHNADKSIDETGLDKHFGICNDVFIRLQGFRAEDTANKRLIFNSLARTRFEHHQEMQGFMVSTQDFEGIIFDYMPELQKVAKPPVDIQ